MIAFLIYVLVLLIVMGLAWWIVNQIPLPGPVKQIATIVVVVICAIILIYLLLGLVGTVPPPHWRP